MLTCENAGRRSTAGRAIPPTERIRRDRSELALRVRSLDQEGPWPMSTISVITPPSEPGVVQLYAVGLDVSAAYVAGVAQATWWLSTEEARQLCHDLGAKLLPIVEGGAGILRFINDGDVEQLDACPLHARQVF
jgi:hypothetical protein